MSTEQPGPYRLLLGEFIVKGRSPDGDTIGFRPDRSEYLQVRDALNAAKPTDGSVMVRLAALEAPELHYAASRFHDPGLLTFQASPFGRQLAQPRGKLARDRLVDGELGFKGVKYDEDRGGTVKAVTNRVRGAIITAMGTVGGTVRIAAYVLNEADAQGLSDDPELPEVSDELLRRTVNFRLLRDGVVYPFAATAFPESHRAVFRSAVLEARDPPRGIWEAGIDRTGGFTLRQATLTEPGGHLIYPYLFRKCIDYLDAVGAGSALSLPGWLVETERAGFPVVQKDDEMLDGAGLRKRLSSLVSHDRDTAQAALTKDPLDLTFFLRPEHRVPLADPADWAGLAPGEDRFIYARKDPAVREVLSTIGNCSGDGCSVLREAAFFHADMPTDPAALKVPVRPVVPVLTVQRRVLCAGAYPTTQFSARSSSPTGEGPVLLKLDDYDPTVDQQKRNEFWVPVGNLQAPLEARPYADCYGTRDVSAGDVFKRDYLDPAGIRNEHLWLTNLVKCFLFRKGHVDAYARLGWLADVPIADTHKDMLTIAQGCSARHLAMEAEVCQPKLIIALGWYHCAIMTDGLATQPEERQTNVFLGLVGARLPANAVAREEAELGVRRADPWSRYNLIYLLHPETLMRARQTHRRELLELHESSMESLRRFLTSTGALD